MGVLVGINTNLHDKFPDWNGIVLGLQKLRSIASGTNNWSGSIASVVRDEFHGKFEGSSWLFCSWYICRFTGVGISNLSGTQIFLNIKILPSVILPAEL